jgi:hypothetical protein
MLGEGELKRPRPRLGCSATGEEKLSVSVRLDYYDYTYRGPTNLPTPLPRYVLARTQEFVTCRQHSNSNTFFLILLQHKVQFLISLCLSSFHFFPKKPTCKKKKNAACNSVVTTCGFSEHLYRHQCQCKHWLACRSSSRTPPPPPLLPTAVAALHKQSTASSHERLPIQRHATAPVVRLNALQA